MLCCRNNFTYVYFHVDILHVRVYVLRILISVENGVYNLYIISLFTNIFECRKNSSGSEVEVSIFFVKKKKNICMPKISFGYKKCVLQKNISARKRDCFLISNDIGFESTLHFRHPLRLIKILNVN